VLFRPLPVPDAGGLRFLSVVYPHISSNLHGVPYSTFRQLAERHDVFAGISGFFPDYAKFGHGLAAALVRGERVTTEYFDVLRTGAAVGRTFVASDDETNTAPAIVISDRFWRARLNTDPRVIGTTIEMRPVSHGQHYSGYRRTYTVVGVMPPGFNGLSSVWMPAEYWVPLHQRTVDWVDGSAAEGVLGGSADQLQETLGVTVVARLQPGVTDAALRATALAAERDMREARWATSHGTSLEKGTIVFAGAEGGRLPFDQRGDVVPARLAMALMAVAGIVLLIAAVNLAGILLARGVARRGEIGVRMALGAGRARVARHVLTETLMLSLGGAVAALALSRAFVALFLTYMPGRIAAGPATLTPISLDVPIDGRVLGFTVALAVVAGVLVGLAPALQALRTNVVTALSFGSGPTPATGRSPIRRWIVVPQICLSLVLLLGAGGLVRTLVRAELADRGFNPDRVVYADVALPWPCEVWTMTKEQGREEGARQRAIYGQLLEKLRSVPGIEAAALATKSSWTGDRWGGSSVVTRQASGIGQNRWVSAGEVSAGYFEAMRIPILRGRAFDGHDTATSTPVAIVSEGLASMLWPDKEAIGQYIANYEPKSGGTPTWLEVVGVARDVKVAGREDRPTPFFYMPLDQQPRLPETSIVVRGRETSRQVLHAVLAGIATAHPETEITRARTLDEEIGEVLYPRRLGAAILAVSGLFGLLLSVVGLYGVVSYSTAQRLREIGIRTALGAERGEILWLLARDALLALAVAVGCGVALGYAAVRVVSSMVVALPALDMLTLVAIPTLLSAVIILACLVPAFRAARRNPVEVLRAL
jgi:predicted permease